VSDITDRARELAEYAEIVFADSKPRPYARIEARIAAALQRERDEVAREILSDRLDRIRSLTGYLEMWRDMKDRPFELQALIAEAEEWIAQEEIRIKTVIRGPDPKGGEGEA
jgi:hypothetical protein